MIKTYCDRCEKEITNEGLEQFIKGETSGFVVCREPLAGEKLVPLTLCKNCKEDLKQFMTKTTIHGCIAEMKMEEVKQNEDTN
jgi:hypothetical protein